MNQHLNCLKWLLRSRTFTSTFLIRTQMYKEIKIFMHINHISYSVCCEKSVVLLTILLWDDGRGVTTSHKAETITINHESLTILRDCWFYVKHCDLLIHISSFPSLTIRTFSYADVKLPIKFNNLSSKEIGNPATLQIPPANMLTFLHYVDEPSHDFFSAVKSTIYIFW